jgi:hypothetical protein
MNHMRLFKSQLSSISDLLGEVEPLTQANFVALLVPNRISFRDGRLSVGRQIAHSDAQSWKIFSKPTNSPIQPQVRNRLFVFGPNRTFSM